MEFSLLPCMVMCLLIQIVVHYECILNAGFRNVDNAKRMDIS